MSIFFHIQSNPLYTRGMKRESLRQTIASIIMLIILGLSINALLTQYIYSKDNAHIKYHCFLNDFEIVQKLLD